MRMIALSLALLLAAGPAFAQSREPAQRQVLIDLAYVLGEAHALRQVCTGPSDQHWRMRMLKMLEAESADQVFEQRLRDNFNTGFVSRQSQFNRCSADSRDAESRVAAQGQRLVRRLTAGAAAP